MSTSTLSAELQANADSHDWAKSEIRTLVDGLSNEQFNWKAQPDSWSIAECVDHLIIIGGAMVPLIQKHISDAREKGLTSDGPFSYGFLGNKFIQMAGEQKNPDKEKVKAPKLYVPNSNHDINPLTERFIQLQDDLIACNKDTMGIDLKRVKISSPAVRIVRLSLGQWLTMLPNHQKRHFQQARRVLEAVRTTA